MFELNLWQEKLTLDEAFNRAENTGLPTQPIVRELGKLLLINKCLREFNIEAATDAEREELLIQFKSQMKLSSEDAFEKFLSKQNITQDRLIDGLSMSRQVQKLKEVTIPDESIKQAFLKQKAASDQVTFSLIRVDSKNTAEQIYTKLKNNDAPFSELAKEFSNGEEASKGGVIGPRPLLSLNPELRQQLVKLKPDEFSAPFSLDEKQWMLVQLNRVASRKLTHEAATQLREQLFNQWVDRQLAMGGLRLTRSENADNQSSKQVEEKTKTETPKKSSKKNKKKPVKA